MQALTLEIIMRAVFGTRDERLRALLATLLDWMTDPARLMFVVLPARSGASARFATCAGRSTTLLREEIAKRRTAPDLRERQDILSMLLSTDMDDATLRDELLTLLVAGHETTRPRSPGRSSASPATPPRGSGCAPRTRTTSTPS